jgi:methyltransferase (TIGR00027 family)
MSRIRQDRPLQDGGRDMAEPNSRPNPTSKSLVVAYMLATHQLGEPLILADPLAARILDVRVDLLSGPRTVSDGGYTPGMRLQLALSHRFADDVAVETHANGTTQLVVLDAGLDTICCRREWPNTRLFEVDDAATQRWKRQLLAATGTPGRPSLHYVSLGPDHDLRNSSLANSGYDVDRATLVIWLESTMFLPASTVMDTVTWFDRHRGRLDLVSNYLRPNDELPKGPGVPLAPLLDVMAGANIALVSDFTPQQVESALRGHGFDSVMDLSWSDLLKRYAPEQADREDPLGCRTIWASRAASTDAAH